MRRSVIALAICCSAPFLLPVSSSVAAPVGVNSGTLVVNTLFDPAADSPVLQATGVFSRCTSVTQLDQDNTFPPGTDVFSGHKRINCADGTLVVAYVATSDKKLPGAHGSWSVVAGTGAYAGANGGGRLTGDDNGCDPMGTDGCVLDLYTGSLA